VRLLLPALLTCALATAADKNAAERLGYPPGARLLIIHADDLAVSHSVDRASFAALESGAATSASIMVPCPWLAEVAAYARAHPDADLGLHLTLTSEWKTYRWGPVATGHDLRSLLDPDGYFWAEVPPVVKNAKPEDVEVELRAQIDRALKDGIRPTHLDSHMGSVLTPRFLATYVKVAHEYGIPFLATRSTALAETDIIPDRILIAGSTVKPEGWTEWYVHQIQSLKPGLTELIVHLGTDDAELQAVMGNVPYGSSWRQRDFDAITSPEFKQALQENHITLVGWKQIRAALQSPPPQIPQQSR
jgi:chitin disaccharide deacetylase